METHNPRGPLNFAVRPVARHVVRTRTLILTRHRLPRTSAKRMVTTIWRKRPQSSSSLISPVANFLLPPPPNHQTTTARSNNLLDFPTMREALQAGSSAEHSGRHSPQPGPPSLAANGNNHGSDSFSDSSSLDTSSSHHAVATARFSAAVDKRVTFEHDIRTALLGRRGLGCFCFVFSPSNPYRRLVVHC